MQSCITILLTSGWRRHFTCFSVGCPFRKLKGKSLASYLKDVAKSRNYVFTLLRTLATPHPATSFDTCIQKLPPLKKLMRPVIRATASLRANLLITIKLVCCSVRTGHHHMLVRRNKVQLGGEKQVRAAKKLTGWAWAALAKAGLPFPLGSCVEWTPRAKEMGKQYKTLTLIRCLQ